MTTEKTENRRSVATTTLFFDMLDPENFGPTERCTATTSRNTSMRGATQAGPGVEEGALYPALASLEEVSWTASRRMGRIGQQRRGEILHDDGGGHGKTCCGRKLGIGRAWSSRLRGLEPAEGVPYGARW